MIHRRKKTSIFYTKYSDEEFKKAILESKQIGELIIKHGMKNQGSNHHTVRRRINELKIDTSHWIKLQINPRATRVVIENLFIKDSEYPRSTARRRILKNNLLNYNCSICNTKPIHRGKELVLILDHINGIGNDHRLKNLRFVCPNCNSQLDTHAGKNKKNIVP